MSEPFHKLLKDFKLNEWFEAADGCEVCGGKAEVMVTHVDDTGTFGMVEWHIDHKADCPEVYGGDEEDSVAVQAVQDFAGWEFMSEPFTFHGRQYYALKSRANIGPCLNCGKLVIGVPLILFIGEGRRGELDFCWGCVKRLDIMRLRS
jgi:hypothetical protein